MIGMPYATVPDGGEFAAAIANNVPLLIAALTIIGGIIAAKVIKPPTYQELATENRSLRKDRDDADDKAERASDQVGTLRGEFEAFKIDRAKERAADKRRIGVLSDGVEAMWSYIQVLIADMSRYGAPVPQPSDYVEATMQRAREARTGEVPPTGPTNVLTPVPTP